jgi:DNA-directed RNA polymerase specialized sigma54-like protein
VDSRENEEEDFLVEIKESMKGLSDALTARLEKMQMFHKYTQAMMKNDFMGMVDALGYSEEILEDMTYPEILESMVVRVADLAKEVGFDINGND